MTGKARERRNTSGILGKNQNDINKLFNVRTRNKIVTPTQITLPSGATNSGTQGNYLPLSGGVMKGIIGNAALSIAISTGDLDLTADSAGNEIIEYPIIFVSPESGTSDTLDTITVSNSFPMGGRITLVGVTGNTITVTHNSGSGSGLKKKIIFDSANGQTLAATKAIDFFYDVVNDAFHAIGNGRPFEIGVGTNSVITSTSGVVHSVDASDTHDFNVNSTLIMRIQETQIDLRKKLIDGGGGQTVDIGEDGTPFKTLYISDAEFQDFDANIPTLGFYRNDSTPTDTDIITQLFFYGKDSGGNKTLYGEIDVLAQDVTNGTEDGLLRILLLKAGSANTMLTIDAESNIFRFLGGSSIKSSSTTEIGVQVTNATLTVGTLGSMEAPVLEQAATPSDATLDGFFGDTNGCFGFWRDTDSDANSRGFCRMNGVWYYWFLANL